MMTFPFFRVDASVDAPVVQRAKKQQYSPTYSYVLALLVAVCVTINGCALRWPEGIGTSMADTIRDGQRVLYVKPWRKLRVGDIVLVRQHKNEYIVKRINKFDNDGSRMWLLGDNRRDSVDSSWSELYGWVESSSVVGLCLWRLPRCFDGPGQKDIDGKPVLPVAKDVKRTSPPLVYPSNLPRVLREASKRKRTCTYFSQFTTTNKGRMGDEDFFLTVPEHSRTAVLYYYGDKAVVRTKHQKVVTNQTDLVTAKVLHIKSDKIWINTPDGFTHWRIWVYE